MSEETIASAVDDEGVATLTLNRPEVHNAFDDALLERLRAVLGEMEADPAVRVVVLAGAGKSFSAGGDLNWMRRMAGYTRAENLADAEGLAATLRTLHGLAKPTIAAVQGAAYGGGVGLVACCDIACASERARFSLSEVKLGLIPAVISPFVCAAIGPRRTRHLSLTGEVFDATAAERFGLVSEVVPADDLEARVAELASLLAGYGTGTLTAIKRLVDRVAWQPIGEEVLADVAGRIADQRASPEGREGVAAFLEKRAPVWPRD